ncbi:MAG: NCS2 family permease [Candidatus Omnitrophica bacterium]|nr:NCS2 family permease [Candidatus Omnitrophota bacterium]
MYKTTAWLYRYFGLERLGTDVRTEVSAGITTFMTMAYIVIVNPKILEAAGIPLGAAMVATILSAFFGTLCMGIYARRPFAIAPYMGENAFIAFTVVKILGYSWQTALGAVFIGGLLFTVLTLLKIRGWLINAIPVSLKYSFAVGIGLFLTFIGLNQIGIVRGGVGGVPVRVGNMHDTGVLIGVFGFMLISILMIRKIKGAILLSIITTTLLSIVCGITVFPERLVGLPPSLAPTLFKLDITGALSWGFFSVILTVFLMDFVDTMGTLIGVSARAGFLDGEGNLPEVEKPMLVDALSTMFGALLGTTTAGTFIESATGIEEGGRSGLTAVVTAILFLGTLCFAPFLTIVPPCAYGPALVMVGLLMLKPITLIPFDDFTELIPAFCVIVLMSFTYNIGIGITAGFIVYPLLKVATGRYREITPGLWVLFTTCLLFYILYPYG